MSQYKKITSGSGFHGVKYETDLLLYYILKVYKTSVDFWFSHGNEDLLKLDDIVFRTKTCGVFGQAKHVENKKDRITLTQLFGKKGKFGLYVYLESFRKYFQTIFENVQNFLKNYENENGITEKVTETLRSIQNMIKNFEEDNESYEDKIGHIIVLLQELNARDEVESLKNFVNVNLQLITNISPSMNLPTIDLGSKQYVEDNEEFYNLNSDQYVPKLKNLDENLGISDKFITFFLNKLFLVVIPDDILNRNVEYLLKDLCSKSKMPCENIYNYLFGVLEKWCSSKRGSYIPKQEFEGYFGFYMNEFFTKELKSHEDKIYFNCDVLMSTIEKFNVLSIKTCRYLLVATKLFENLSSKVSNELILYLNPFSNQNIQLFILNAFISPKYTHLICILTHCNKPLVPYLKQTMSDIRNNPKFNYKKIILLCDDSSISDLTEVTDSEMQDDELFQELELKLKRDTDFVGQTCYISRHLENTLITDQVVELCSEENFLDIILQPDDGIFLIADGPGMGKTTLISSLASRINNGNKYWAIRIELNFFTKLLKRHHELRTIPVLEEFMKTPGIFEQQISYIPNILILILDGFDEIAPKYTDIVTKFIKNTRTAINIRNTIVTTRKHLRYQFEKDFKIRPYALQPFTYDEICLVISRIKKQSIEVVKEYFPDPRCDGNVIPLTVYEFLSTPLHVKMFAQSIENSLTEFQTIDLNLYELYNNFLINKRDIFVNDKSKSDGNVIAETFLNEKFDEFITTCTNIALEMIFHDNILKELKELNIIKSTVNNSNENLLFTGILEFDDSKKFRFVHRTLMEYFVAKWALSYIFHSKPHGKTLEIIIKDIFCSDRFDLKIIREFIDNCLKRKWMLIPDNIFECFSKIGSVIIDQGNQFNSLHQFPYCFKLIMQKIENPLIINKVFHSMISASHDNENLNTELLIFFNQKGADITCRNDEGKTVLHMAASGGNYELVKYLVDAKLLNVDVENELLDMTPFHEALVQGNNEICMYLISKGADIRKCYSFQYNIFKDKYSGFLSNTNDIHFYVLCLAAERGSVDLFKLIMRICENNSTALFIRCSYPLLDSCSKNNDLSLIEYVVSQKYCNILEKTSNGRSVLHLASLFGNIRLVNYLLALNMDFHETTDDGETVLHLAVQSRNSDLVKLYLSLGVDVLSKMNDNRTALDIIEYYKEDERPKFDLMYILEKYKELDTTDEITVIKILRISLREKYNKYFKTMYEKYKDKVSCLFREHLFSCVDYNNLDIAKFILSQNVHNLFKTSLNCMNILQYAALKGNIDFVKYFLHFEELNRKTFRNETILHFASQSGNLELVQYLVGLDMNTNEKTSRGENLLHFGALSGNLALLDFLIDMNVDIYEKTLNDKTVLHFAVQSGFLYITEYFVCMKMKTNVEKIYSLNSFTISMNVNINGKICGFRDYLGNLLTILNRKIKEIKINSSLKKYEIKGNRTAEKMYFGLVNHLQQKIEENINLMNQVSGSGNIELTEYFIILNMELEKKTRNGKTLLHYSAKTGHEDVLNYLLDCGIPLHEKTVKGKTVLHYAARSGNLKLVKSLIDMNVTLYEKTSKEETVLHFAAFSGNLELTKYILDATGKIDEVTSHGETILHWAAQSGNLDLVKYLVGLNIKIDVLTSKGETVLHYAAAGTNLFIVMYFVKLKIDVKKRSIDGETALDYAKQLMASAEIIKYLESVNK